MAMQTRATPGVYAIDRSSRVLTLILPRTSILPPRCMRKVRSETLTTFTPVTARIRSTTCWPWRSSRALNVRSRVIVDLPTSTRSIAPMSPPALPMADVTRPSIPGLFWISSGTGTGTSESAAKVELSDGTVQDLARRVAARCAREYARAQPTTRGRPHDRRQDGRPGAHDLREAADLPGGDPHAPARRGDPRAGEAPGAGLQEAQHELPGHRHVPALRLDHRAHPRGQHLLARHRRARAREADPPAPLRHPLRGHVHGDQGGG